MQSGMDGNMPRRRPVGRPRRKCEVRVKVDAIKLDLGMWSGQCWPTVSMELHIPQQGFQTYLLAT